MDWDKVFGLRDYIQESLDVYLLLSTELCYDWGSKIAKVCKAATRMHASIVKSRPPDDHRQASRFCKAIRWTMSQAALKTGAPRYREGATAE